jgi:predicted ATPase/DNA-binding XRE family transcriptional regulator
MKPGAPPSFGAQLKALRERAGFTQEELATIAGLSVHAVSALERGERRRPHVETLRALSAALDLTGASRDALLLSARAPAPHAAVDELSAVPLPSPLTTLIGRDADLKTLRHWLADAAVRLVTLTGPGGVGKTSLALELARGIAAESDTRVVFVPLAAIRSPALVAPAIAEGFGLSDVMAMDWPKRVRAASANHPTLLLLDNFEQLLDAASLVAELLATAESVRVLATSRSPLRLRGEREYPVGPLTLEAGVEASPPADLARAPAVRLFVARVRDVQQDFRLTAANGPTVTAICRRLDALPLALELAAPWLKVLTPEDLLRRLTDDVLLSTAGSRDLPERQQTITATVAWSYQLLNPEERRAFRHLGILPGRFSIEAAATVLADGEERPARGDEALSAIAVLIEKSLLLRAETAVPLQPRYRMLETVRAYAAIELAAAGERDGALERVARYCAREAALASQGLAGPAQAEWLDRVRDDLENYRTALTWLIERGRAGDASDIAWGLMAFWLMRGHLAEGLQWYERTLSLPSLPPAAESKALVGVALMWYAQGELERARTALARALSIADAAGDRDVFITADNLLGHLEQAAGNLDQARVRFARSVEAFRTRAVPWGVGNALSGLAAVALSTGDVGQAERLLLEATAALREAGPWFLAPVTNLRAILAAQRGKPDEAMALVRDNLARIRELQDKFAFVYALVALAAAAALKGDDAWAARILGAGDVVTERTGAMVVDKSVQDVSRRVEREVRARLGPDRWTRAYSAGRTVSIDSLMKDIDRVL